ncbi:hypothetical protein FRB97_009444 [Tulasnella sp. 331]|nr:hypothetical protein FRB97_009444 [Tulasnella sp. 331]
MDEVCLMCIALLPEEEELAIENGINLKNILGSTECAAMLCNLDSEHLCAMPETSYEFWPIDGKKEAREVTANAQNAAHASLFELVVLLQSADCPDPSVCDPHGNYRTGDLFQEANPRQHIFRGYADD